jgi:hypothetical protein
MGGVNLHCINCGHKQSEGKYCAACGTALGNEVIGSRLTRNNSIGKTDTRPNETVEKVKMASKMYWSYLLNYLKNPSDVLNQEEKEFVNGIVNIVIMAVLVGLSFFILLKRVALSFLVIPYEPHFFSTMSGSLLFILITTAIVICSLLLTLKFLGPVQSFKRIVCIYGTQLIPSTFLVLIAFILLLLKAYTFGNFLLSFALLFAFLIVPLYILIRLLKQEVEILDPHYCVAVYVVIFGIAFSILFILLGDFVTGSMMGRFNLF